MTICGRCGGPTVTQRVLTPKGEWRGQRAQVCPACDCGGHASAVLRCSDCGAPVEVKALRHTRTLRCHACKRRRANAKQRAAYRAKHPEPRGHVAGAPPSYRFERADPLHLCTAENEGAA